VATPPTVPDQALVEAVELILRPLARLFVEQGLVFPTVEELLKQAYVRVTDAEFPLDGEPPSDSRISILSGVHRKDVRRLRAGPYAVPRSITLPFASEVVTRWISDARYLDAQRRPRVLPRTARGSAPSFDGLVASISKDVRPRVLLDELERLGVAAQSDPDHVELLVSAFVPQKDRSQRLFYLGRNVHDHLAACAHNLAQREPSMMEQSVYSFELSDHSVADVAEAARREWASALGRLIRVIAACEERDRLAGQTSRRINVGMYFFHEAADSPATHGPRRAPAQKSVAAQSPRGRRTKGRAR
jgi:hypothetical protein